MTALREKQFSSNMPNAEYWCFISYRHADNRAPGRQWATWLHQQIETYEVPADLVGKTNDRGDVFPERIFPVFRDEDELGRSSAPNFSSYSVPRKPPHQTMSQMRSATSNRSAKLGVFSLF